MGKVHLGVFVLGVRLDIPLGEYACDDLGPVGARLRKAIEGALGVGAERQGLIDQAGQLGVAEQEPPAVQGCRRQGGGGLGRLERLRQRDLGLGQLFR
jgi:hypothetical protein